SAAWAVVAVAAAATPSIKPLSFISDLQKSISIQSLELPDFRLTGLCPRDFSEKQTKTTLLDPFLLTITRRLTNVKTKFALNRQAQNNPRAHNRYALRLFFSIVFTGFFLIIYENRNRFSHIEPWLHISNQPMNVKSEVEF
ncbi:hypothetical protein, partial [Roseibium album]|uniref:hypothetical protein n=1 Tax=Roseibium album TaxID=311410 RepID=UPI00391AC33E